MAANHNLPPPTSKNSRFSKERFKERQFLNDKRSQWGGEKAKLQRRRKEEARKNENKVDPVNDPQ